jgi:HPt (histidine-containing phosphotransfer) domain-containing protein
MSEAYAIDPTAAPPASAGMPDRPVDLVHLSRMTFGDRALEREVLDLFVRQAATLLAAMEGAAPGALAPLAHRLKGSARGIGAWRVATAAEAVERAVAAARPEAPVIAALPALAASVHEATAVIEDLLRSH